jgi:hypothetical protein
LSQLPKVITLIANFLLSSFFKRYYKSLTIDFDDYYGLE